MIVLATVFALVGAPFLVILTHGPAAHAMAAEMAENIADEIAAHGHAHDEAGQDHQAGVFGGHNPADHDHQLHAVVCNAAGVANPLPHTAPCAVSDIFRTLTPEGPRRPPRSI